MTININTLREMVKAYQALGVPEYDIKISKNNLVYDENNQIFKFFYTLKINNEKIDNSIVLFKGDIIRIINYFFKNDIEEVKDYTVLVDDEKEDVFINLEMVKNKQKVKRS